MTPMDAAVLNKGYFKITSDALKKFDFETYLRESVKFLIKF